MINPIDHLVTMAVETLERAHGRELDEDELAFIDKAAASVLTGDGTGASPAEQLPWSIDGLVPLAERKIPERTWLIEDLIPKQSLVLMSALPGHGKSILAYALGRAISEGRPFAGLQTQECPVLYVDRENDGAYWRSEIMAKLFQEDEGENFYFNVGTDVNQPPELNNLGLLAWIESCEVKPFIIIDSLSKYLVGQNENLAQDVDPWMMQAIALRNMGCTILIVHHMGKQGTSRGSTAIVANVDWALDITRTEAIIPIGPDKGNIGLDTLRVKVSKGRGAHQDHDFKFNYVSRRFESTARSKATGRQIPGMEKLLSENPGVSGSGLVQFALDAKIATYRDARAWVSTNLESGLIRPEGKGSATRLYWRENEQPQRQGNLLVMPGTGTEDVPF